MGKLQYPMWLHGQPHPTCFDPITLITATGQELAFDLSTAVTQANEKHMRFADPNILPSTSSLADGG